jgi:molybdenum cofactor cytidylyltransferase
LSLATNKKPKHKVACAILAAGLSSRFGSPKQLAKVFLDSKSLIQNAVDIANGTKSDYIFVVLGHGSAEIMEELKLGRAQILLNKDYREGLSSSIRTSIANLPDDCSAIVLMVADQPYLTSKLVDQLIESLKRKPDAKIASLAFENEPRNPAIFSKQMFPLLKRIKGDRGARDIVKAHRGDAILINLKDRRVFLDIDTRSGLKRAIPRFV